MSASFGRYAPRRRMYGEWASRSIWHPVTRETVAACLLIIRRQDGAHEAREFRNYLLWLGTYPVQGSARWRNLYERPRGREVARA